MRNISIAFMVVFIVLSLGLLFSSTGKKTGSSASVEKEKSEINTKLNP